jgi:hypothetical protein
MIRIGDSGTGFVGNATSDGSGLSPVAAIAVRLEGYVRPAERADANVERGPRTS